MKQNRAVSDAVRIALATGVAIATGSPGSTLAQEAGDPAIQEKVTVTGSRIKRVDIEGPSPVSVITRDHMDRMKDGAIVQVGTAEEILTNPANEYVAKFVEDVVRDIASRLEEDPNITWYSVDSENFESIHNHSAYAHIASNHLVGEPHLNS